MGMPSKVTLNWPSWKPRIVGPSLSCKPGPFGSIVFTEGVSRAISAKLSVPLSWFWIVFWFTTEVGWVELSVVRDGVS